MSDIVLLGPQAIEPNLGEALQSMEIGGPFCVVTAGWQERAGELEALEAHIEQPVIDLMLYQRAEQILEEDRELFEAHRRRQNRLREMQRLYRIRLSSGLETIRQLKRMEGDPELLEPERQAALEVVRDLDRLHLGRLDRVNMEFEEEWCPSQRPSVEAHCEKIEAIVRACSVVLVAGGHVAVLLNRLRLFRLQDLLREKKIVAWSGGAMALSERLVLFHDSPPQGPGDAEVLERGLGIFRGVVPLPHASRRLRLEDPVRVSLFASRFAPDLCVAMDRGSFLHWNGTKWLGRAGTRLLTPEGGLREVDLA